MHLLLADDLTGACDSGIFFAARSMDCRVYLGPESLKRAWAAPADSPSLLALNTATRNLPREQASEKLGDICLWLAGKCSPQLVYKKIDSAMRGNAAEEIDVIMKKLGLTAAFITPALPDLGRKVQNGVLLIDGTPVNETAFADDPLMPVREAFLPTLLGAGSDTVLLDVSGLEQGTASLGNRIQELLKQGIRRFIFDALDNGHLEMIARAGLELQPMPLFAGSAGLARAIALELPAGSGKSGARPGKRLFNICGSGHKTAHEQIARLTQSGMPVFHLPGVFQNGGWENGFIRTAAEALKKGDCAIATPLERLEDREAAASASETLASAALRILKDIDPADDLTLVITGGETAQELLSQMCDYLRLERELLPGVVLSSIGNGKWAGMSVVTKSGGFGDSETLLMIAEKLRD